MEQRKLSERVNINKFIFLIWLIYSIAFLLFLRSEAGYGLLEGNFLWDCLIVMGGLVSLIFTAGFTGFFLTVIWVSFDFIKNWLFDK